MPISDYLLYRLARVWPSPVAEQNNRLGAEPGTEAHSLAYTREQFNRKIRVGLGIPVWDKEVLEMGCGHGGISCFLACAGTRRVVGIDLNTTHLAFARRFAKEVAERVGSKKLNVEFLPMNAYHLGFASGTFDIVVADNTFEHFDDPEEVMRQAHRVLRPGGKLMVPTFSSIRSKYGPHIKYGLHLPWTQLLFSERTVIRAMRRLAKDDPRMNEVYPNLDKGADTFRGLRKHNDLNDITHQKFLAMADRVGFDVDWFKPFPTYGGFPLYALKRLRQSTALDVLSTGASALLIKR